MTGDLLEEIAKLITSTNIKVLKLREHSKATERYVDAEFLYQNGRKRWVGSIPYFYRRMGLFLENPQGIANLIVDAYASLEPSQAKKWVSTERRIWEKNYSNKLVTKPFFDKLLSLNWNCVDHDLPKNRNWARRIQDIKEMGYLLATNTRLYCNSCKRNTAHTILIPLEKGPQTGYEVISPKLKKRILKVLGHYNAYEGKVQKSNSLIPDHKFPEISWDEKVRQENLENLTDEEIKAKFQLLDNQRNLEKREACRKVIQTGERGTIFGIKYYYEGDEDWPEGIPKVGKEAEKGWIGSPWYDIEAWRESLNRFIKKHQSGKKKRSSKR